MTLSITRLLQVLLVLFYMFCTVNHVQANVMRLVHPPFKQFASECIATPSFHVNSVSGYIKALELSNLFRSDTNIAFLPLCIELPTSISSYDCTFSTIPMIKTGIFAQAIPGQQPLQNTQCYNLQLDASSQSIFVTEKTKAFVIGAQMFLSESVTYNTFIHELAHFAFFAEEYTMREALKASQCRFPQDRWSAPNLWAVPKGSAFAKYSSKHPFADLYKASLKASGDHTGYLQRTCSTETEDWYTLVPDTFTFLRYNDITYIPDVYKYMWQAQLRAGRFATH